MNVFLAVSLAYNRLQGNSLLQPFKLSIWWIFPSIIPWDEPQRAGVIGLLFSDNKNLNTRRVLPESEPWAISPVCLVKVVDIICGHLITTYMLKILKGVFCANVIQNKISQIITWKNLISAKWLVFDIWHASDNHDVGRFTLTFCLCCNSWFLGRMLIIFLNIHFLKLSLFNSFHACRLGKVHTAVYFEHVKLKLGRWLPWKRCE